MKVRCSRDFLMTMDVGSHLRPVVLLMETAQRFSASLTVSDGLTKVDGKSLTSLIIMCVKKGSNLRFCAEGPDAEALLDAIGDLFASGFDEKCVETEESVAGLLSAA